MSALVSVVIPTLNAERYLADALDSVAAQTYSSWEVVLVDGGSTDGTVELARRYERVRILRQRGRGLADAWNCGLEEARGELTAFLDSDDCWEPQKLTKQVAALEADTAADCAISRARFVLEPGFEIPPGFRPELLESHYVANMPSALLARRSVFERIGAFDTRWELTPDIDWFARAKDAGIRIEVVPEVLVSKRVHDRNLSTLGRATLNREVVVLLRESVERQRRAGSTVAARVTLDRPLETRAQFVADVRDALDGRRGFAAGKLGLTERAVLRHPLVLEPEYDQRRVRAFELVLAHRALRHGGIFPVDPGFLLEFAAAFADAAAALDSVGVRADCWPVDDELFRAHGLRGKPIDYLDQEPDRSVPADEERCWLPLLRGRRVLLVCPFAELLRERATGETFEAVWRKTGKPWFEPAAVDALEFPYGFARSTWEHYGTALDLLADVRARVEARTYDVALIAAGALGSMVAVAAREQGRVGISLGGHLQVLFGVAGRRWRERPDWRRDYIDEAWIDMPERYRPDPAETDEDYW